MFYPKRRTTLKSTTEVASCCDSDVMCSKKAPSYLVWVLNLSKFPVVEIVCPSFLHLWSVLRDINRLTLTISPDNHSHALTERSSSWDLIQTPRPGILDFLTLALMGRSDLSYGLNGLFISRVVVVVVVVVSFCLLHQIKRHLPFNNPRNLKSGCIFFYRQSILRS